METVTDNKGRVLTLRRLNALQQARIVRMVGAEDSENRTYMLQFVFPACSVSAIDGEDEPIPASRKQLDNLIDRLDDEGIAAVNAQTMAKIQKAIDEAEASQKSGKPTDEAAALKN